MVSLLLAATVSQACATLTLNASRAFFSRTHPADQACWRKYERGKLDSCDQSHDWVIKTSSAVKKLQAETEDAATICTGKDSDALQSVNFCATGYELTDPSELDHCIANRVLFDSYDLLNVEFAGVNFGPEYRLYIPCADAVARSADGFMSRCLAGGACDPADPTENLKATHSILRACKLDAVVDVVREEGFQGPPPFPCASADTAAKMAACELSEHAKVAKRLLLLQGRSN